MASRNYTLNGSGGAGFQLFTRTDNNQNAIFADAAARDTYFTANANDLATLDANEFLIIKLLDDGSGDVAYQQRQNSAWVDVTSLIQGEDGRPNIPNPIANQIYKVDANGVFQPTGVSSDETGELQLSSDTLNLGIAGISNFGGFLFNVNNVTGFNFQLLDARLDKTNGSSRPNQFSASEAATDLSIQSVESTQMSDNPLVVSYTTQLTGYTYRLKLKTYAEMTNVKIQMKDVASGRITRQYPSSLAFNDDTAAGLTLPLGEVSLIFEDEPQNPPANEIYLGFAPFTFFPNRELEITIKGDNVALLGDGTTPYTIAEHQAATLRGIAYQDEIRTDEQIEDLIGSKVVAGTGISIAYDDTTGETTITATGTGSTFNAPRITNFGINIASRVDENTNLNLQKTITFDAMHSANIDGDLTLEVTTGDNKTITSIVDGSNTKQVTLSGIDTSSAGTVAFKLSGTDTQGDSFESNTVSVEIRTLSEHEFFYYGTSGTNNPASINVSTLTSNEATTGTEIVSTGAVTSGQYFIILVPTDHDIQSIVDDVLQQDVTSIFTKTTNVRQINSINYNSYVIGPLNAASGESYTLTLA